jgi:PAS domain S-box-containing protein
MRIASTRDMTTGEGRRLPPTVLAETSRPAALVSPVDGRIHSANPACEGLFGAVPGGLAGRHLSELSAAPTRSPEERANTIARSIATTGAWSGEAVGLRADGSTFTCVVRLLEAEELWLAEFEPA